MDDPITWKDSPCQKSLVRNGARQVRKPALLKER